MGKGAFDTHLETERKARFEAEKKASSTQAAQQEREAEYRRCMESSRGAFEAQLESERKARIEAENRAQAEFNAKRGAWEAKKNAQFDSHRVTWESTQKSQWDTDRAAYEGQYNAKKAAWEAEREKCIRIQGEFAEQQHVWEEERCERNKEKNGLDERIAHINGERQNFKRLWEEERCKWEGKMVQMDEERCLLEEETWDMNEPHANNKFADPLESPVKMQLASSFGKRYAENNDEPSIYTTKRPRHYKESGSYASSHHGSARVSMGSENGGSFGRSASSHHGLARVSIGSENGGSFGRSASHHGSTHKSVRSKNGGYADGNAGHHGSETQLSQGHTGYNGLSLGSFGESVRSGYTTFSKLMDDDTKKNNGFYGSDGLYHSVPPHIYSKSTSSHSVNVASKYDDLSASRASKYDDLSASRCVSNSL